MKQSMKKMAFASSVLMSLSVGLPLSPLVYAETPQYAQTSQKDVIQELINQGYLERIGQTQRVKITEKYKQEVLAQTDLTRYNVVFTENSVTVTPKFQTRSFSGVNKIVFLGWGFDVYLDSTNANKLSAGYSFAVVAAGFVPEPVVSKVLAAGFAIGSGAIRWHNAAGRGIILTVPLSGGISWIRSQ